MCPPVSDGKVIKRSIFGAAVYSQFRSPTPQTHYFDAWPSRYCSPTSEPQSSQPGLLAQRRGSIVNAPSLASVSIDVSQDNYEASRRSSVPHIESKSVPLGQGPSVQPLTTPKPSKPLALKLYPWMTQKESSPPRRATLIKCPYPTEDCTETLPKNMITWRRHLGKKHGLAKDNLHQTCQWPGCGMTMGGRSLNRHVLMNHMDFKPSCPYCNVRRRYDHMDRHILNCSANPARELEVNKD